MNSIATIELPETLRKILATFRESRESQDSDLWQSTVSQLRTCTKNGDELRTAFCELVCIDLPRSWQTISVESETILLGTQAVVSGRTLEDYLAELPELSGEVGIPVELFLVEREARARSGQSVDLTEYERRFPREWPTFQTQLMETLTGTNNSTSVPQMTRQGEMFPRGEVTQSAVSHAQGSVSQKTAFGDYELLHEIARGGMGVVYKARQTKLNRIVAIKMILAGQLASEEHIHRFYSEAEAAARLDHPGIVPIYEVGRISDQHFFSMGYVDGDCLAKRVSNGPLTPEVAATVVKAVAEATAYAHSHGVIHRDLKPQNILITADGHPKITDFGLAKTIEGDSGLTASGQILGTPSYMPPEQAAGRISQIGPASDVYSLGAVLYCLLTGRPPFQSPNVMETLKQVMSAEPVSPRLLSPSVNRDLETICLKCLEKDPARRLSSAQELADELGRFLKGEPIRSRRVGPLARAGRWCRKNPLPIAFLTAVLVLIGLSCTAWMMAQDAARTKKFAAVKERFQQVIDAPELTATYLKLGESILNEMTDQDRVAAEAARDRLHSTFINQLDIAIRKPKLEPEQMALLTGAIELVDKINPGRATEFKKLLDQRSRHWVPIFDLKPPFSDLNEIFNADDLTNDQHGMLVRQKPSSIKATSDPKRNAVTSPIRSKTEVNGDLRFEATYDKGWKSAELLGFVCCLNGDQGYAFILQRNIRASKEPATEQRERSSDSVSDPTTPSQWAMRLTRNGAVLREQVVELKQTAGEALRLQATRLEDRIQLQVNDLPALVFDDAFALSRFRPGGLGLILPADVGITRFTVSRRPQVTGTNPLDRGDEQYSAGKIEEALAQYQEVAISESDVRTIQEAQFKQASCLSQLGRTDEATPLLLQLFAQPGDRWPMLAGTLLWVSFIRDKRLSDAEGVYERLSTQFPFERLAALVTDDVRREILAAYRPGYVANTIKGISDSQTLIRDYERLWIIQKLLQPSGAAFEQAREELYQVYLFAGDFKRATRIVEEAYATNKSDWSIKQRIHLLRCLGRFQEALQTIEAELIAAEEKFRKGEIELPLFLMLDRIRCNADLKRWDQVDQGIQECCHLLPIMNRYMRFYFEMDLRPMEGLMLARHGDQTAAVAAWRTPLLRDPTTGQFFDSSAAGYHLLRSLSGDLDLDDVNIFLTKFEGPQAGQLGTMMKTAIAPASFIAPLRDLWNSPRGQDWVEKFVFQQIPLADAARIRLSLISLEYIRLNAFRGQMTEDQSDIIWNLTQSTTKAVATERTLTLTQLMPLALTWKGNTSVFAWDSAAAFLPTPIKAHFAYLFAHRFLQLGRPAETAKFLKISLQHAESDSQLAKNAKSDLELLESGFALIRFRTQTDEPIHVVANFEGRQSESIEFTSEGRLLVRPGNCELQIATPQGRRLRFANPRLELVAGETATAIIETPWDFDSHIIPLPGVVPTPTQIPGIRRWQLVSRESSGGWNCARINPDHRVVAIGGRDGHVRLWDVASQQTTKFLVGHSAEIRSLAWHPREPRLAAGADDGTTHIWNTITGHHEVALGGHTAPVMDVAWSPDGKHLVTTGSWGDGSIRLWSDTGVAGPKMQGEGVQVSAAAWNPDSTKFATVGCNNRVRIWDLNGHLEHEFESPDPAEFITVAWSPDGRTLATGGRERAVRLWNVIDRTAGPTFSPSDYFVLLLAWNADATRLAVGTQDGYVTVYDKNSQTQIHRSAQQSPITSVQWSPDFTQLFTTGWDGSFRWWSNDCLPLKTQSPHNIQPIVVEFSPDHEQCVNIDPARKIELHKQSESKIQVFPQAESEPATVVWSPDGRWIAVSLHNSRSVSIWNPNDGSIQAQGKIEGDPATQLAWNSESTRLAIATSLKSIQVLDLEGNLTTAISNLPFRIRAMDWRPNSNSLAIIFDWNESKQQIQFWDLQTASAQSVSSETYGPVDGLKWSPTGKHYATIHAERAVVWDAEGKSMSVCAGHTFGIKDLCWSPDGQSLATASYDGTARIWTLNGESTRTLTVHSRPMMRIHWGTDGRILTGSSDHTTRAWSCSTGQLIETTFWLPAGNSVTVGNTGEVRRRTPQANEHVLFVVERPLGGRPDSATEALSWEDFEHLIGVSLERPAKPPTQANDTSPTGGELK